MQKLMYRGTQCTLLEFLSAILATSVRAPTGTIAVVQLLLELWEDSQIRGQVARLEVFETGVKAYVADDPENTNTLPEVPESLRKLIRECTAGNCYVET